MFDFQFIKFTFNRNDFLGNIENIFVLLLSVFVCFFFRFLGREEVGSDVFFRDEGVGLLGVREIRCEN